MPYDIDKTPLGFFPVLFCQQIGAFSGCMCSTLTVSVLVSPNLYVIAGISELQTLLNDLDEFLSQNEVKDKTINCHLTEILKLHRWIIG